MYTHVFGNVTTDSSLVHIHRDSRSFSGHPYFRIEALTSQLLSALIRGISWGTFFFGLAPWHKYWIWWLWNKYWNLNWSLVFTMMMFDVRLLAKFACSTFPTNIRQRLKGSMQTIILYLRDAKRVKTRQPQLMWQFLRATSICFGKLWYNASGFTHAVTPIGFANFRHWVEGFCHTKSAVWHVPSGELT